MTEEDRLDAQIAKMFDELTETHVTQSGKAVSQRTLLDEALKGDEMREACEKLVAARKKFERLDSDIRKYSGERVRSQWWDELHKLSAAEEKARKLFLGNRTPTRADNMQWAAWRRSYLEGEGIKVVV